MPRLFHFSEDPRIELFVPRSPLHRPGVPPMVWTVDEERAWTYLFPRDCPRVLLWPEPATTGTDLDRWFGGRNGARIACIEWTWLETLANAAIFRYELDPAGFHPVQGDPWMWVSAQSHRPREVQRLARLLDELESEGVELRVMPSLAPLQGAWEHSFHVSGIRLRNAAGWPGNG